MQHILNIAFDFDDEKVKSIAENAVEKEMDVIIRELILDEIAPKERSFYGTAERRNWGIVQAKVERAIADTIDSYKDEIIEKAANTLADRIRRSKAWKEKYGEVTA